MISESLQEKTFFRRKRLLLFVLHHFLPSTPTLKATGSTPAGRTTRRESAALFLCAGGGRACKNP